MILGAGARPDIIGSYNLERKAHVKSVMERSIALGQPICETDPVIAKAMVSGHSKSHTAVFRSMHQPDNCLAFRDSMTTCVKHTTSRRPRNLTLSHHWSRVDFSTRRITAGVSCCDLASSGPSLRTGMTMKNSAGACWISARNPRSLHIRQRCSPVLKRPPLELTTQWIWRETMRNGFLNMATPPMLLFGQMHLSMVSQRMLKRSKKCWSKSSLRWESVAMLRAKKQSEFVILYNSCDCIS